MAFDRAVTALANVEDHLRKLLKLAGNIGASFEPKITPVIIAGDLREAGLSSFTGRHFAYISPNLTGTNNTAFQCHGLTFPSAVLIDEIFAVGLPPSSRIGAYQVCADTATAMPGMVAAEGVWLEGRKTALGDVTPINVSSTTALVLGAAGFPVNIVTANRIAWWTSPPTVGAQSASHLRLGTGMQLEAGSQIWWDTSGCAITGTGIQLGVYGRIAA